MRCIRAGHGALLVKNLVMVKKTWEKGRIKIFTFQADSRIFENVIQLHGPDKRQFKLIFSHVPRWPPHTLGGRTLTKNRVFSQYLPRRP